MKQLFIFISLLVTLSTAAQDSTQQVRAFPITDYMVDLPSVGDNTNNKDSIKIVQLQLPESVRIPEKKMGLLKGMYRDKHADTATIGYGRCQLIKGNYYYFAINNKKSGIQPREGDLIYVMLDRTPVYQGLVVRLAAHYIGLKDVYDTPLYNRYSVFIYWKKDMEDRLLDSLVADIRYTADYFVSVNTNKNDPSMNVPIKSGPRKGKLVLNTMLSCTRQDVINFLEYMIARPNFYAGHEWKVSEVFATWLVEGGPTVLK